jgi:hypothetical protein
MPKYIILSLTDIEELFLTNDKISNVKYIAEDTTDILINEIAPFSRKKYTDKNMNTTDRYVVILSDPIMLCLNEIRLRLMLVLSSCRNVLSV